MLYGYYNSERWLSGRRRRSRKPLTGLLVQGFESPSLRHLFFAESYLKRQSFIFFEKSSENLFLHPIRKQICAKEIGHDRQPL